MPHRLVRGRRRSPLIAAAALTATVAAGGWAASDLASAGTLSGTLYLDPSSQVVRWVAANPNDSRTAVIRDKIASQAQARWLSNFSLSTATSDVSGYVNAAYAKNQVPVLSVYGIPNRDCGGASAGGAPDLNQYQQWITRVGQGLGKGTTIIILETDALALQTCLSAGEVTARDQALSTAVQTLKSADPSAKVYLDGGHSAWNSATEAANRLKAAGVQYADGFFTNVSNFQPLGNEASFGRSVIAALNSAGISGKHQIIDTSRNGGAAGDWCADDNTDRRIGNYPTLNTGDANIDGYLWVKPPGEADGCVYAAGSFVPDLAYSLANGVPNPPTTPVTTPPTTPPTTPVTTPPTTPVTTPPTTPSAGCVASATVVSQWTGGYQATVTVKAGSAPIGGWRVAWTLGSGQGISQLWNGQLTVSGSSVTVSNLSWNGSLAAGASASFGYIGSGTPTLPAITCTAG